MSKNLKCVMLVDDDEATNFIHRVLLETTESVEAIVTRESAQEALDYIKAARAGATAVPNLILLDINMPAMNGWEFLDAYRELLDERERKSTILMVTTSLDPSERERARTAPEIFDFQLKPLTYETLQSSLSQFENPTGVE